MSNITCAECGVVFGIPDIMEQNRRDDHGTFYCPNGHHNHYPGPTKQEKQIKELEQSWARTSRILRDRDQEAVNLKHELRRCPICEEIVTRAQYIETIRQRVADHLRDEHGARARLRAITEKASA